MDEDNDLTESAARVHQLPADGTPNIIEHVSRAPFREARRKRRHR
jgi:hypothetical protein